MWQSGFRTESSPRNSLGPRSPLSEIETVDIPVAEDRGGTCFYAVDIVQQGGPGQGWRVWRRFNEFRELRENLASADATDGLPSFPSRTLFKCSCATNTSRVNKRRHQLSLWLRAAVMRWGRNLPESLQSFLGTDSQQRGDRLVVGCVRITAVDPICFRPFCITRVRLLTAAGFGAAGDEVPASRCIGVDCGCTGKEPESAPLWLLGRRAPFKKVWEAPQCVPGCWIRLRLSPQWIQRVVVDGIAGPSRLRIEVWPDAAAKGHPSVSEEVNVCSVGGQLPDGSAFAELILRQGWTSPPPEVSRSRGASRGEVSQSRTPETAVEDLNPSWGAISRQDSRRSRGSRGFAGDRTDSYRDIFGERVEVRNERAGGSFQYIQRSPPGSGTPSPNVSTLTVKASSSSPKPYRAQLEESCWDPGTGIPSPPPSQIEAGPAHSLLRRLPGSRMSVPGATSKKDSVSGTPVSNTVLEHPDEILRRLSSKINASSVRRDC